MASSSSDIPSPPKGNGVRPVFRRSDSWNLPCDARVPTQFPYRVGQSLSIRRHVPPPPFGLRYQNTLTRQHESRWKNEKVTDTEWCLRFPPQESTELPLHLDTSVRTLHIAEEIACRPGHGAQVVRCRLDDGEVESESANGRTVGEKGDKGSVSTYYIAKIYDALYYSLEPYDGDLTYTADRDYSCEAAAYEHLCKVGVNGRYTPTYFGSWTFDTPVPADPGVASAGVTSRPIRMILMEWIPGTSMYHHMVTGRVHTIPIPHRLELMAEAMEAFCQLMFYGVQHMDFEARNVVVADAKLLPPTEDGATPPSEPATLGAVVDHRGPAVRRRPVATYLIDFNQSYVLSSPCLEEDFRRDPPTLPTSPMHYFWRSRLYSFGIWVPVLYRQRREALRGWLKSRWSNEGYRPLNQWELERNNNYSDFEYIPPESIPWPEEVNMCTTLEHSSCCSHSD